MELLSIIDIFNIQEYYGDLGSNWIEIISTAFLSGIVAWFAAYIQIDLTRYYSSMDNIEKTEKELMFIIENIRDAIESTNKFNAYLKESIESTSYDKDFRVPDKTINTVPFEILKSISIKDLYSSLDAIKIDDHSKKIIRKALSSCQIIYVNYNEIRKFHSIKFDEYNNLVKELNSISFKISVGVQQLVFSEDHLNFLEIINSLELVDREPFRKRHPKFNMYQALDKATKKYQDNKSSDWKAIEEYYLSIKNTIKEYSIYFPDIVLAQDILSALLLVDNLKQFYISFLDTFESYLQVNQKQQSSIIELSNFQLKLPKKVNYIRFKVSK